MSAAIKLNRTNTFAGKCCVCGVQVPSQRGYLLRGADVDDPKLSRLKWLTLCTTRQCALTLAGEEAVVAADRRALLADGTIEMPAEDSTKALRRAMGSWDGNRRRWVASPLLRDRDHVLAVAAQLGLEVAPEFAAYEDPAPVRAAVERARAIPTIRDYQIEDVRWLAYRGLTDGAPDGFKDEKPGGLLALDMGLGKTLEVLESLHDDEALLVVCSANAKGVWPREAAKWRPDRFDSVHVCNGEESFRWPTSPRELVVINYDVLPYTPALIAAEREKLLAERNGVAPDPRGKTAEERRGKVGLLTQVIALANECSALMHRDGGPLSLTTADRHHVFLLLSEWCRLSAKLHKVDRALRTNAARRPAGKPPCKFLLVFDEVHYAENNRAQRTTKCRHLAAKTQRIYGLTGTPVDADPLKLWGLLQTIRATPFTWTVFREQFSAFDGAWGGIDFLRHPPAPGSTARGAVIVQPGTTEILRRCMLRRTKDDPEIARELPPKMFSEIPIELDEKLLAECDEITATYGDLLLSGELPPFEAMSGVRKALAAASIPATLELVEEYEEAGEPLLVFSAHTAPVEKLGKRKGWYAITGAVSATRRGEIQDAFQGDEKNDYAGAKGHGVAGTQAMAESMTLTRARTIIQVDPFWKRAQNEQAYDRVHRLGQRQQVHVIRLVPDHPLTRHIGELLCGKDQFVADVLTGAVKVDVPPSRFTDADQAEWERIREAKQTEDAAREAAAEQRRRAQAERELAQAMERDAARVDAKTSEKRAKARYERLVAAQSAEAGDTPTSASELIYAGAPKAVVREALAFMLSICDGANTKDSQGFNKPDGAVARWLAPGVEAGTKYATATAAAILRHYPRQLRERFPELFTQAPQPQADEISCA